ncbi:MAG: GspH/FimT family pseudopilin [Rhodoferax sp.]
MRQSISGRNAGLLIYQAGYSLVELLVVMALGTILLSIAVPSMTAMLNSQRSAALGMSFLSSLNLARSEAIKRNARAVLCKSPDGLSCARNGGYEQGWIVFHDVNNNAALDEGEQIIELQGPVWGGLTLIGNTPVANYVSFSASGSAKLLNGAFQAGTFTLCLVPVSGADVRQLVLSNTGRARSRKGLTSDCG